jgi:hypothetical protein
MALRAFANDEWVGFASDRPVGDAPVHDEDTNSPDQSTYIRIFLSEAILSPGPRARTPANAVRGVGFN